MNVTITGMGVLSPIGIGTTAFGSSLKQGFSDFSVIELEHLGQSYHYPAALIKGFDFKSQIDDLPIGEELKRKTKRLRNLSQGASHGIYAAMEAWSNAGLVEANLSSSRTAIVSSGSNTQRLTMQNFQERYREKIKFMNPTYGFRFLDTDIIGALSELLEIKGEGFSVGAASASGNMAIIQACRLIANGEYEVVMVVAPSMELSVFEYQGFTALGAMAVLGKENNIKELCNPFDQSHCGFVYGQNAGALILESKDHAERRSAKIAAKISGYGVSLDANRNPNPSVQGEAKAMQNALDMAKLSPSQIDAINTHGTASGIGDQTELEAILSVGMKQVKANATKALIGHGISAAGVVEAITSVIELEGNFLHPNPNLKSPISDEIDWIKKEVLLSNIDNCMTNSFGFGGVNTSIIIQKDN